MTNIVQCLTTLVLLLTQRCDFIAGDSVVITRGNNDYDQFSDDDFAALPKCCPLKTSLLVTDQGMNCTPAAKNDDDHVEVYASNIATGGASFFDACDGIDCVDFVRNDTDWQLARFFDCEMKTIYKRYSNFPKCCPFDYAYDPQAHACAQRNQALYTFNDSLQVINVSLSKCPRNDFAIVDFHHEKFRVHSDKSVTLDGGRRIEHGRYCIDNNARSGRDMIRACIAYEDACVKMKRACFKKCCPDGEAYQIVKKRPTCSPYYGAPFNLSKTGRFASKSADYNIILANNGRKYIATSNHEFHVDDFGYLHILEELDWSTLPPQDAYYCAEHFASMDTPTVFLFVKDTLQSQFKAAKFYAQITLLALSSLCLIATIVCYIFLPEMQNVHSKSILMYCVFMFVAFLMLCVVQLNVALPRTTVCTIIGFTIVFAFLGSFAWMNVICFDMWMTLGTMRVLNLQNKKKEHRKLLWYSLYGCGVPIVIGGLALIFHHTKLLPDRFVPDIGQTKCFFAKLKNTYDYLVFFIIPECTMILINILLFVKTAMYCYRVKNEIQRMRSTIGNSKESKQQRLEDDKEKFHMLVKLFFVMGIPWTFEALTTMFDFKNSWILQVIELIMDCFNACQGVIIFCIFILKQNILMSIKTRLGMMPTRRVSELSTGITNDLASGSEKDNRTAHSGKG